MSHKHGIGAMRITCCHTDEAAGLALHALLPLLKRFADACGVALDVADVSLAARIQAAFPESAPIGWSGTDPVATLARRTGEPGAVIVKWPGISATPAQLRAAITELQCQGWALPEYPETPRSNAETAIRARYDALLGSMVNALLRQGTSVRRVPNLVKEMARQPAPQRCVERSRPPSAVMRSRVASMDDGDFRATEQALTLARDGLLRIEHTDEAGHVSVLHEGLTAMRGDVIDAALLRYADLTAFLSREIDACRRNDLLFALPLKCTSLRVSDPAIFAAAVHTYYRPVIARHRDLFDAHGLDPSDGFQAFEPLTAHSASFAAAVEAVHAAGPLLAIQDPDAGHSILRAPGGTSIAAFMAGALRAGAHCTGPDGAGRATAFVIPDRCETDFYRVLIDDVHHHGPLDPARIGSVTIIGLTADAADEYGAQDSTFQIKDDGWVRVLDQEDNILMQHAVAAGDVWRLCRRSRRAIAHWIERALAQHRSGRPVVFWLDASRPRDRETLRQLCDACPEHDWEPLGVKVMDPARASTFTLARVRAGLDVVAATGNLLRDYLGEFFGRAEAGASSFVEVTTHLLGGGVLFEAGAGGCAPAIARDFMTSNHLRWNPLGDLLAWHGAFDSLGTRHAPAAALARALGRAIRRLLAERLMPAKDSMDLRVTVFHLARLWAQEMGEAGPAGASFAALARRLESQRQRIENELMTIPRQAPALAGYYRPDARALAALLHASPTLTEALQALHVPAVRAPDAGNDQEQEGQTWCVSQL